MQTKRVIRPKKGIVTFRRASAEIMLESALVTLLLATQITRDAEPGYTVERQPAVSGSELITIIKHVPTDDSRPVEVPILSILRDTLGDNDPENDRLRYVWVLTASRPTLVQRALSGLPFAYFRVSAKKQRSKIPRPFLDMASPSRGVWANVLMHGVQALQFDSMGAAVRSVTRSYRGNFADYRDLKTFQALTALEGIQTEREDHPALSVAESRRLYARLTLSSRMLGGLVSEDNLGRFYNRDVSNSERNRAHNWELLRQRAELCGLYFETLNSPDRSPTAAMLWVSTNDLEAPERQRFDRQFLNISSPWTDRRLTAWEGYTEKRYLDNDSRSIEPDAPGAHKITLIPLALYSLEYPRVPLLMVDFRDQFKPKKWEALGRFSNALVGGVFGISRFTNWWYLAANSAWTFARTRHGATTNRVARLQAYVRMREFLEVDSTLTPELKTELLRLLDHLALNPLENSSATESQISNAHYAALLQFARSPNGLGIQLDRDRQKELETYTKSGRNRLLLTAERVIRRGPRATPEQTAAVRSQLDRQRRIDYQTRFLKELLASSADPEVVWDSREIVKSVEELAAQEPTYSASTLIARVLERSQDEQIRAACLRALARFEAARNQLDQPPNAECSAAGWGNRCSAPLNEQAATGSR